MDLNPITYLIYL